MRKTLNRCFLNAIGLHWRHLGRSWDAIGLHWRQLDPQGSPRVTWAIPAPIIGATLQPFAFWEKIC